MRNELFKRATKRTSLVYVESLLNPPSLDHYDPPKLHMA